MYTVGASPREESTGKLKKRKKKNTHTHTPPHFEKGCLKYLLASLFLNVSVFYIILWKGQTFSSFERIIHYCFSSFCLSDIVILNSLLCSFMEWPLAVLDIALNALTCQTYFKGGKLESFCLTEALEFRKRGKMVKCDFSNPSWRDVVKGVPFSWFAEGVEKERGMHK